MRLVIVVYEAAVEESIQHLLTRLNLAGWTKLEGATGFGRKGLREGTAIWPGTNNLLFVELSEGQLTPFLDALARLKRSYRRPPGVHAFVQAVTGAPLGVEDIVQ